MTPVAPTATWRKVCEDYFARLVEDLEQHVDSEVDSRVATAVDAAVRGAVSGAVAETRRAIAEELNQSIRRVRACVTDEELYTVLLDVTTPYCDQAVVFSVNGQSARAERMRRPVTVEPGEGTVAEHLPALEIPIREAAAFSAAIESRDPVVAMCSPGELSAPLVALCEDKTSEKVYLFPLVARDQVTVLLFGAGRVQAPPLELLCEVTALQLENLTPAVVPHQFAAATAIPPVEAGNPPGFVSVSTIGQASNSLAGAGAVEPPASEASVSASGTAEVPGTHSGERSEWWKLSRDQQQMHLAAQRFARVQVAQMRLTETESLLAGRARRDIYGALKPSMETARQGFREKFMSASSTMVDYLHLEIMRSLADDNATMLGPNYPGPLL